MQPELFSALETEQDLGKKLLEIVEKAVYRVGLKEFAFIIQKESSQLRDAFSGNGKYFSITWLASVIRRDPQGAAEFINALCDIAQKEYPQDKPELTPEEELKILKQKIKEHGLEPLFRNGKA